MAFKEQISKTTEMATLKSLLGNSDQTRFKFLGKEKNDRAEKSLFADMVFEKLIESTHKQLAHY